MSIKYKTAELTNICKYFLGDELQVGNALEYLYLATKTESVYKKAACMNVFKLSFIWWKKIVNHINLYFAYACY